MTTLPLIYIKISLQVFPLLAIEISENNSKFISKIHLDGVLIGFPLNTKIEVRDSHII
jgi:hypothetical protein